MIIGCLQLPNKWAVSASIHNQPFVYRSSPPTIFEPGDAWGNLISVDKWFNNYKIICQDEYKITEFWCINLKDGIHDSLLVPILMKRYMNTEFTHKAFLLKNGIFDLLMETNKHIPNFNSAFIQQYGCAEILMECLSEKPGLFEGFEKDIESLRLSGALLARFPSGRPFPLDELLRRCTPIELYAKSTIALLNSSADLSEISINNKNDLLKHFLMATPVNMITGIIDVDWIGESILAENLTHFTFNDVKQTTLITPNSHNLMNILSDTVKREEIIAVPNLTTNTILQDFAAQYNDVNLQRPSSEYNDLLEHIDLLVNLLILDDATTYIVEFDGKVNQNSMLQFKTLERIYGYGYHTTPDHVSFPRPSENTELNIVLMELCDILNAIHIRLIKTYNEELFITITYNSREVRSYYYNLVVHACVSGCLFSA